MTAAPPSTRPSATRPRVATALADPRVGDGAAATLALLRQRSSRAITALDRELSRPLPALPAALAVARRWVATGAGGSEGPARAFVAALEERGVAARFRPLSSFALRPRDDDGALVVFSQGLSPNARLALAHRPAVIVTAVDPEDTSVAAGALRTAMAAGALRWPHGPRDEGRLLLRVEGPARATLAALRLAAAIAPRPLPADLTAAVERATAIPPHALRGRPIALVTAGDALPYAHGLRWKLLEGLGVADPPVWDVLQVAHGPLQQFYDGDITLLCLEGPGQAALFDRLERAVVPSRHEVRRLVARLAHPFGWFEHDAQLNALLVATLQRRPRDLVEWPGKGRDGSLYELSAP